MTPAPKLIDKNKTWQKRIILLAALFIFIAALISSFGLHLEQDILSILPDHDPQISQYRQLIKHFNPMDMMFVDLNIQGPKTPSGDRLIHLADTLAVNMRASGLYKRLVYKWEIQDLNKTLELLRDHRGELFTTQDSQVLASRMEPDSIYKSLARWKKQLTESPSPFLLQQMLRDPLGFDQVLYNKIEALHSVNQDMEIVDGHMFSQDHAHLLLIAYPKKPASDNLFSARLVTHMDSLIQKMETQNAGLQIAYLSGQRFSAENAKRIKRDIRVTVTISVLAISILALLVYSRPLLMLLTLLPAIFGSVVALGCMRWFVPNISAMVIGSGAMLIGLAVDYGIHFLYHLDQEGFYANSAPNPQATMRRLQKPLLLSALSTVIAFMTLRFSILPGYQQLAFFVSLGIVSAFSFVSLVLPLIVPHNRKPKKFLPNLKMSRFFASFFNRSSRHQKSILVLLILFSLTMIPGALRLHFEGDVQKLNAVSPEIRKDMETIQKIFGSIMSSTYVMVKGKTMAVTLEKNDRLTQALKRLQGADKIISFNSITAVFPAFKNRQINIERWDHLFSDFNKQDLQKKLNASARQLNFRSGIFSGFIQNLRSNNRFLRTEQIQRTVLKEVFNNQVSEFGQERAILCPLKIRTNLDFADIKTAIQEAVPDAVVYNGKDFVTHIIHLIFSELKRMGSLVILFIFLLLLIYKRSIKTALALMLPLVLSALWTFGLMGWLGIEINIINSIVSVFVFGLIVDYCFFLQAACLQRAEIQDHYLNTSGAAVSLSAMTTMLALGTLLLAQHPAMHSLGLTALLGIGSGLIAVLLLIPIIFCPKQKKSVSDV